VTVTVNWSDALTVYVAVVAADLTLLALRAATRRATRERKPR